MLREDVLYILVQLTKLVNNIDIHSDLSAANHLPSFQLCDGYSDKLKDFHKRLGIGTSSTNSLFVDLYHEQ